MAGGFLKIILFSILTEKVIQTTAQTTLQQYLYASQLPPQTASNSLLSTAFLSSLPSSSPVLPSQYIPSNVVQTILPTTANSVAAAQNLLLTQPNVPRPYALPAAPNLAQLLPSIPLPSLSNVASLPSISLPPAANPLLSNLPLYSGYPNVPIDQDVLNNLAIALQLLIVNNMMNAPPSNAQSISDLSSTLSLNPQQLILPSAASSSSISSVSLSNSPTTYLSPSSTVSVSTLPGLGQQQPLYTQVDTQYLSQPYYSAQNQNQQPSSSCQQSQNQQSQQNQGYYPQGEYEPSPSYAPYSPSFYSNANFLASSYIDGSSSAVSSYGVPKPQSRTSLSLISPYEAISSSSPFSDPILSSGYGSIISSKKDFQSPYQAILSSDYGNTDLWS